MANMSYCQFENTVGDMRQCLDTLQEAAKNGLSFDQFMERLSSGYERAAVRKMAELLQDMADAFEKLHDNEGLTEEQLEELEELED
jgi:DNA polymerase III delta prime subunit